MAIQRVDPNLSHRAFEQFANPLEGDWGLIIVEQSMDAENAANVLSRAAFVKPPEIIRIDGYEPAIRTAQDAGRIILLSHIDQPHVGDLETSAQWESFTRFVFLLRTVQPHKTMIPSWHPFMWRG